MRAATILLTLIASWYGMMLVHELGHVLAAFVTGSRIDAVRVPFFGLSQTEIATYKHPIVVIVMGPVVGVLLPLAAWLVIRMRPLARRIGPAAVVLSRFFAGFCLVANGGYLASGLVSPVGDVADLAALGEPMWLVGGVGLAMAAVGLAVWNGLGPAFGLGVSAHPCDRALFRAAYAAAIVVLAFVVGVRLLGANF